MSDVITAAAQLLLTHSDRGWLGLLTEHIDDGTGHCPICRGMCWPCSLWAIGRRAQELAEATRPAGHRPRPGGAPRPTRR